MLNTFGENVKSIYAKKCKQNNNKCNISKISLFFLKIFIYYTSYITVFSFGNTFVLTRVFS